VPHQGREDLRAGRGRATNVGRKGYPPFGWDNLTSLGFPIPTRSDRPFSAGRRGHWEAPLQFLATPAFLVMIATPTQAADIHKIIVGVFTAAIAVAAITLALSMPAAAGFTGNDMLPPARLTAPLINGGCKT